jgi:hypothetical protein
MLYGSSISYFTGKMENYFRVKGITYKRIVAPYPAFEKKMIGINEIIRTYFKLYYISKYFRGELIWLE